MNAQQDSRWRSSLRRHDPELQPTLPSINNHSSSANNINSYPGDTKKIRSSSSLFKSAFHKSRSIERIRALRNLSSTKNQKEQKKSSSEEGNSDDQENSVEEISNTNGTNSPKLRKSPKKKMSGSKHKNFNSIGYELGLVDTIEKEILQKNPKIYWQDIAGLSMNSLNLFEKYFI